MGIVGYIIFFIFMMWMMRNGGCCGGGHRGHKRDKSHNSSSTKECSYENHSEKRNKDEQDLIEMVHDPVCGMNVEKSSAITRVINGRKYYFCSDNCAEEFMKGQ